MTIAAHDGRVLVGTVSPWQAWQSRRRGQSPRGSKRMVTLCEQLGDPHRRFDSIHIVGTDAKTSTTLMIGALLRALGVTTGETISPHLERVNERIRLHGASLTDEQLGHQAQRVDAMLATVEQRLGESPTFFEAITATAFATFAGHGIDTAVVEAGIGGVGDATGMLGAGTVVLTPVGLDHSELGATLAEVAREKAGVAPPGASVVVAAQRPEVHAVVTTMAEERGWTLRRAGIDFGVITRRPVAAGQMVGLRGLGDLRVHAWLPVHGAHQAANAAVALATVQAHLGVDDLDHEPIRAGLRAVRIPGRAEVVHVDGVPVIIDGAHDPTAAGALAAVVGEIAGGRPVTAVVGSSGDRDPASVVGRLPGCAHIIATGATTPGAQPATDVAERCRALAPCVATVDDVALALERALRCARPSGVVVVTGSLYLAGVAREVVGAWTRQAGVLAG